MHKPLRVTRAGSESLLLRGQPNSKLRPNPSAIANKEKSDWDGGLELRVRPIEVRNSTSCRPGVTAVDGSMDVDNSRSKQNQVPSALLIEEFYEYGGKAVCSNHVFNFKIGK